MNVSQRTPSRLVLTVALTASALLLGIIGAVAAGTGTVTPPPKIAFVAAGGNFPDALAVGPMAGRLGAPLFLTPTDALNDQTKDALVAYDAALIIVAGGPNTVNDSVLEAIAAATGLAIKDFDSNPTSGIVRAFGLGREATAAKLADLLANYNPNFLPTDATAADSDLLDGRTSADFARSSNTVFATSEEAAISVTGETLASTDIVLPNECAGADNWTVMVMAAGYTIGESVPTRVDVFAELVGATPEATWVSTNHTETENRIPWAVHWVYEGVDAGTWEARARGRTLSGSATAFYTKLTAMAVSNTC